MKEFMVAIEYWFNTSANSEDLFSSKVLFFFPDLTSFISSFLTS